jgi:hypothetical protein
MWLSGYFAIGFGDSYTRGATGAYSMNLLSLFDSRGFSRFLPAMPLERDGQVEGFAYLGLGLILLIVVAVIRKGGEARARIGWPLMVACIGLTLFAISPIITLGHWHLVDLPNYFGTLSEIFRAAGRMFWPAFYVLMLVSIGTVLRRFPTRAAIGLLGAALVLQMLDLSPLLGKLQWHFSPAQVVADPLKDPFWQVAGKRYKRLLFAPSEVGELDWLTLDRFAAGHGMATNYGYFARSSWYRKQAANEALLADLKQGKLDPDAIYVLCNPALMAEVQATLPSSAGVGTVDGYQIIAPIWMPDHAKDSPAVHAP